MTDTQLCPCGSERKLAECCLPLLQGKERARTAEQLLRSRYTAFVRGDVDYIVHTHHSRTRDQIKREEVEEWSKNSQWLGLKILQKEAGEAGDEKGAIAFHAQYQDRASEKPTDHFEYALFEKEGGEWRFADAHPLKTGPVRREEPKIGRNDPCPCGSGKKHKKCCG